MRAAVGLTLLATAVAGAGFLACSDKSRRITAPPFPALAATAPAPAARTVATTSELNSLAQRLAAASADELMREIQALARFDPARAIDLAHRLGRNEEEQAAWVVELARGWATRAPQAAWDWLSQQSQTRLRELAAGSVPAAIIDVLAAREPYLLVHNVDQLVRAGETPFGVAPVIAVHLGLEALVAHDQLALARRTVEAWAADPTRPAMGEAAYAVIADALRAVDAGSAGRWLLSLPRCDAHDIAMIEFPARWAAHEPQAALAWIEEQVPPELRARAVQRAFGDWAEQSPAAAGEWLGQYLSRAPAGPETDRLIGALLNLGPAVKTSPALALQWAKLVSDGSLRSGYEERIVLRWAKQDTIAAQNHLTQTPTLTPARKRALLQRILDPAFAHFEE